MMHITAKFRGALAAEPAVDEIFSAIDRNDAPGCALGVIRDGEFVYREARGAVSGFRLQSGRVRNLGFQRR